MTMQFIDLEAQQKRIRNTIEKNILAVLDHGRYIMGPEVIELEKRLAEYVGTRFAVACSSGTDALLMALMAHDVGPGDAVLTTPFTFIATAEVIHLLGAVPVFVDIEPDTFNIDPDKLEKAIEAVEKNDSGIHPLPQFPTGTIQAKGIIAVDLFGVPADYRRINAIAEKHGLFVIEDAAQSFGAQYHGQQAGSLAPIGCTSFFPAKPLGGYGDGGAVFTNSEHVLELLRSIRIHGQGSNKYDNVRVGINGRLDTLQAAVLLAKLDIFPEEIDLRQQVAQRYSRKIRQHPSLRCPEVPERICSAWAQYSIVATDKEQRDEICNRLTTNGVPVAIYYPVPLHLQPAFSGLDYQPGDFPISEQIASCIFSVPMHPYLQPDDQDRVVELLVS